MKRLVIVLILIAAAVGAFVILHRGGGEAQGPKLAPAGTVLLLDFPDIARTRERWQQAALHQLAQEPEVQAFLERPESRLPALAAVSDAEKQVASLEPAEAFFALTSIKEDPPRFLAGLNFNGKKEALESLRDEARTWLHTAWPAGKADLVKYGPVEIETFVYGNVSVAAAVDKRWYVVSDDIALLKTTLDRLEGKPDVPGEMLAGEKRFHASLGHVPKESDLLLYLQPETVIQRLADLLAAAGAQLPAAQTNQIRRIQAAAAAVKLEGENIRDTLFILAPDVGREEPLQRASLALTSTNTLFYYAAVLRSWTLPDTPPGASGFLDDLAAARQALAAQGLDRAAFDAAFGPEVSARLDWPPGFPQPGLLVSLDVRDEGKAEKFLDGLLAGPFGAAWARQKIDDTVFYGMTSTPLPTVTPALALTPGFLLLGQNFDEVKAAAQSLKTPGASLASSNAFQTAEKMVAKPTGSFGYLEGQAVCERVYGSLRPLAMIWANFAPGVVKYIDPSKLPATETLQKHLGPIVFSESAVADGMLLESAGPVTFQELVDAAAMGAGAAALPKLKALQGR